MNKKLLITMLLSLFSLIASSQIESGDIDIRFYTNNDTLYFNWQNVYEGIVLRIEEEGEDYERPGRVVVDFLNLLGYWNTFGYAFTGNPYVFSDEATVASGKRYRLVYQLPPYFSYQVHGNIPSTNLKISFHAGRNDDYIINETIPITSNLSSDNLYWNNCGTDPLFAPSLHYTDWVEFDNDDYLYYTKIDVTF